MKNKTHTKILESVRSISKQIVKIEFPEELEFFDVVWDVMKGQISIWKDLDPEDWIVEQSQGRLMSSLGVKDPTEMPDITAPIIIGVLAATFWHIGTLRSEPTKEYVEKMIVTYSGRFGASEKVENTLKEFVPASNLVSLIRKEMVIEKERLEEKTEEKKISKKIAARGNQEVYARIWNIKTKYPGSGEIISKEQYKNILKDEEKIPLLIIKNNGIRSLFIYGKATGLPPIHFDLLEYVLKNRGHGGDLLNLLEKVWRDKDRAKELRQENDSDLIRERTSHIRGEITSLNKFLLKNLKVEIKSHRRGQYKFTRSLEYYLIEIL